MEIDKKYKIRTLTRKDRRTISEMITKAADKVGKSEIFNMIKSGGGKTKDDKKPAVSVKKQEENMINIGISLIKMLIETLEDDIEKWFSDLLNTDVKTFNTYPLDVELKIIEQLKAAPEIASFFSGASQLSSWIGGLKGIVNSGKKALDSATT